jgi:hypothetical protein
VTREFENKRHGTVSLLAGIDLVTGKVHALVKDRHRSREFIEFLKLLDTAYPTDTAIKVTLDNHSAHTRIMAAMDFFNRDPIVHTWTYKLDQAVLLAADLHFYLADCIFQRTAPVLREHHLTQSFVNHAPCGLRVHFETDDGAGDQRIIVGHPQSPS